MRYSAVKRIMGGSCPRYTKHVFEDDVDTGKSEAMEKGLFMESITIGTRDGDTYKYPKIEEKKKEPVDKIRIESQAKIFTDFWQSENPFKSHIVTDIDKSLVYIDEEIELTGTADFFTRDNQGRPGVWELKLTKNVNSYGNPWYDLVNRGSDTHKAKFQPSFYAKCFKMMTGMDPEFVGIYIADYSSEQNPPLIILIRDWEEHAEEYISEAKRLKTLYDQEACVPNQKDCSVCQLECRFRFEPKMNPKIIKLC